VRRPRARLTLALAAFVVAAGCDRAAPPQPDPSLSQAASSKLTLRRGHGGDPSSLDPQAAPDHYAQEILRDLFEGLTTESADGNVVPGVATRWSVSSDGRVYRFELREDARWSDGSRVVADDFVAAFRRAVDLKSGAPTADLFRAIRNAPDILGGKLESGALGIRALSPSMLEIELETPVPFFPALLTHTAFSPRHPSVHVDGNASARSPPIGNGAYQFEEWIPNLHIAVRRNPFYWDRQSVKIERVVYYPIAAEADEYLRYRAGDIDLTASVPLNQIPALKRERPNELRIAPSLATYFIGFNLQRSPFANNRDLRQALSLAIDREAIATQVLHGMQLPAYGLVPSVAHAHQPQAHPWASISKEQRIAMARAHYARATAGLTGPIRLRVIYGNSQAVRTALVAISDMWKAAFGLELEIETEEFRVYLDRLRDPARWELMRMAWVADYNDAGTFLELFRHGNPNNFGGYFNPRFDDLLTQAQRTNDPQARALVLQDAERLLLEDHAFIPLFHMLNRRLVSPRVVGFNMSPLNRIYSRHLELRE
jgi:oligopeptide transport system substrate-binding protein